MASDSDGKKKRGRPAGIPMSEEAKAKARATRDAKKALKEQPSEK
jgi:hypothetical protein